MISRTAQLLLFYVLSQKQLYITDKAGGCCWPLLVSANIQAAGGPANLNSKTISRDRDVIIRRLPYWPGSTTNIITRQLNQHMIISTHLRW